MGILNSTLNPCRGVFYLAGVSILFNVAGRPGLSVVHPLPNNPADTDEDDDDATG